jgi:hypothetical protein
MDVCSLGGDKKRPLYQDQDGGMWSASTLYHVTKSHLRRAGLGHKMPYDFKYDASTEMRNNPQMFSSMPSDSQVRAWIQDVMGHERSGNSVDRYAKLFGSPGSYLLLPYYNAHRMFPFRVEDYPVMRTRDA